MPDDPNQYTAQLGAATTQADISTKSIEQLISTLTKATKGMSDFERQTTSVLKKLGPDAKAGFDLMKQSFKDDEDALKSLQRAWDENVGPMLKVLDNLKDKNDAVAKEMKKTLSQMGFDTRTEMEKTSAMVAEQAESAAKGALGAIQKQVGLGSIPGLEKLGIWGALIGSVIAVEQYMRTSAATVLSTWKTIAPQFDVMGKEGIQDIQGKMQEFWVGKGWQFVMGQQEMEKIWGAGAVMAEQYGGSVDEVSERMANLADKTATLDMTMGKQFGSTMQRMSDLVVRFGQSSKEAEGNLVDLSGYFAGRGYQAASLWGQLVFDLQGRLGALGVNIAGVTHTVDTFGKASESMGGGMDQAAKASEGLFNWFKQASVPMQAIMGKMAVPGTEGLAAMNVYQQLISGFEVEGKGFQEYMPQMLQGVYKTFLKDTETAAIPLQLEKMGMDVNTAQIMMELVKSYRTGGMSFEERFAAKDIQEKVAKMDPDALKNMLQERVSAVERAITSMTQILMLELKMVVDGIVLLGTIMSQPWAISENKRMIEGFKAAQAPTVASILAAGGVAGTAVGEFMPGSLTEGKEYFLKAAGAGVGLPSEAVMALARTYVKDKESDEGKRFKTQFLESKDPRIKEIGKMAEAGAEDEKRDVERKTARKEKQAEEFMVELGMGRRTAGGTVYTMFFSDSEAQRHQANAGEAVPVGGPGRHW